MSLLVSSLRVALRPTKGSATPSMRPMRLLRRAAPVVISATLGTIVLASLWFLSKEQTRSEHSPMPLAVEDHGSIGGGGVDGGGSRGDGSAGRKWGIPRQVAALTESSSAPSAAASPPRRATHLVDVGPRPFTPAVDMASWPATLDAAYATAFISPQPSAHLASLLARLAGGPLPAHPHPLRGPLRLSSYAQWYRRTNPTAVTLRLGRPAGSSGPEEHSGGTIPGAVGIGKGPSAGAKASPLGRPACAARTSAGDIDDSSDNSDDATLAVFGGSAARWYVNAVGRVLRVGSDGVGALVDVGGGVKEGDWPDDPPLGTTVIPRTVPFSVAPGGVDIVTRASGPYMGEGMIVHLGQHHGTTFFHVYNEVLLRLLAVLPLLRAYPASRVLLPQSAVTRGAAEAIGIPAARLAPAPPDNEWVPATVVVAPPPVKQAALSGVYPKCGIAAVAKFLRAVLEPPSTFARSDDGGASTTSSDGSAAATRVPPRTLLWISRSATATAATGNEGARCTGKRCVANEAEVVAGLAAALGDNWTVSIFPHNGGLVGAVRAFGARPDIVVGVHGAGWQNMVFAGAPRPTLSSAAVPLHAATTTPVAIHISSDWRPNFFAPTATAAGYRWARLYHAGVTHYGTGLEMDVGRLVDAVRAVVGGTFDYSTAAWERQRRGRGVAAVESES